MRNRIALVAGLLLVLGAFAPNAFAGTARTQANIDVFVDCATQGSGSYDATFGYTNQNSTPADRPGGERQLLHAAADRPRPDDRLPAGHRSQRLHGQGHPDCDEAHLDRVAERAYRFGEREFRRRRTRAPRPRRRPFPLRRLRDEERRQHLRRDLRLRERRRGRPDRPGRNRQLLLAAADRPRPDDRVPAGLHHAAFTVNGIPNATKLAWTVPPRRAHDGQLLRQVRHATSAAPAIHVSVDCVTSGATTYDATFVYATTARSPRPARRNRRLRRPAAD